MKPLIAGDYAVLTAVLDSNVIVLDLRNGKIVNQISLADKGYVLSAPLIVGRFLIFSTTKGIFVFAEVGTDCYQNREKAQM